MTKNVYPFSRLELNRREAERRLESKRRRESTDFWAAVLLWALFALVLAFWVKPALAQVNSWSTQPNIHGGRSFYGPWGQHLGESMPNVFGGEDFTPSFPSPSYGVPSYGYPSYPSYDYGTPWLVNPGLDAWPNGGF